MPKRRPTRPTATHSGYGPNCWRFAIGFGDATASTIWSATVRTTAACSTRFCAAAATSVPVLVLGEPGTGRRTVARAIHMHDRAAPPPLVPFDCAALPPEVLERELFGAWKRSVDGSGGAGAPPRLDLPAGVAVLLLDVTELHRDLQCASCRDDRGGSGPNPGHDVRRP